MKEALERDVRYKISIQRESSSEASIQTKRLFSPEVSTGYNEHEERDRYGQELQAESESGETRSVRPLLTHRVEFDVDRTREICTVEGSLHFNQYLDRFVPPVSVSSPFADLLPTPEGQASLDAAFPTSAYFRDLRISDDLCLQMRAVRFEKLPLLAADRVLCEQVRPEDVAVGQFDCFSGFLSVLSWAAGFPQLISRVLKGRRELPVDGGRVCCQFFLNEQWRDVEVDDVYPVMLDAQGRAQLVTCRLRPKSLWVALVHKAYAKSYGSFAHTMGKVDPQTVIRDLTGFPAKRVGFSSRHPTRSLRDLEACHRRGFKLLLESRDVSTSLRSDSMIQPNTLYQLESIQYAFAKLRKHALGRTENKSVLVPLDVLHSHFQSYIQVCMEAGHRYYSLEGFLSCRLAAVRSAVLVGASYLEDRAQGPKAYRLTCVALQAPGRLLRAYGKARDTWLPVDGDASPESAWDLRVEAEAGEQLCLWVFAGQPVELSPLWQASELPALPDDGLRVRFIQSSDSVAVRVAAFLHGSLVFCIDNGLKHAVDSLVATKDVSRSLTVEGRSVAVLALPLEDFLYNSTLCIRLAPR